MSTDRSQGVTVISTATTPKGWLMPKVLCLIGMVLAILVFLIFLADLVFGLSGMLDYAPLRGANYIMDIVFMLSSGALIYLAYATFREQK
ncbi:MAG: hypothetical protein NXI32_21735 [bacterium]|nr:hypothetical protein [bacterium]